MVSVALATYNGEKYIRVQMDSILSNLELEDEIIVSDDGSSDQTLSIIRSFNDQRIKIIHGPGCGLVQNFANAVANCSGDIIFLCDQDDIWYANKVKKVCAIFERTDYVLIEHDAKVTDESGNIIYPSFFAYRKVRTGVMKNIIRNTYHGCLIAFKSELKEQILPFPNKGCLHDQWIGIIAELEGKTLFFEDVLMEYKRHENNASSFKRLPIFIQVRDRAFLMKNIIGYRLKRKIGYSK